MSEIHEYPVTVDWQGARSGSGQAKAERSGATNKLSVPPEFQGPGDGTNPEELLTSAIAGCYSITFGIVAENRKLPMVSMKTEAVGEVEKSGALFVYTKVRIKPTITLSADASDEQVAMAADMAHKADNYCIITNAVRDKVSIVVEPTVIRA